jgi:hypothetical protein
MLTKLEITTEVKYSNDENILEMQGGIEIFVAATVLVVT